MDHFLYRNGTYYAEDVPLSKIAREVGSPCYIYSRATLERHWKAFDNAFGDWPHTIYYAVKSNSNLGVLGLFAHLGSGFDIVSSGELQRVIRAGGDPDRVVFSGVGKTREEIYYALSQRIRCFNVESLPELDRINAIAAELDTIASIAIRVNPDVDAQTHPYISTGLKENKFGIPIDDAISAYHHAQTLKHLHISGVTCHIGSQLTSLEPFEDCFYRVLSFIDALKEAGVELDHVDVGGGLGVTYRDESPPHPTDYTHKLIECLKNHGCSLPVMIEPGRVITANAGVFLTQVQYIKNGDDRNFAVVDGAMNDLLRPALYQAWQKIISVTENSTGTSNVYDVVGPVCESADFLGKQRMLDIAPGDLLAVRSAGAYGHVMSSNYNSRPRPPEVLVDGDQYSVVRERESFEQMILGEHIPEF